MKYIIKQATKKSVVIDFMEYDGSIECEEAIMTWGKLYDINIYKDVRNNLVIPTLEGPIKCNKGSIIIKDINNKFYPCDSNIFINSYNKI